MRRDFVRIGENLKAAIASGNKGLAERLWRDYCANLDEVVGEITSNSSGDTALTSRVTTLEKSGVPAQIGSSSTFLAQAPQSGQDSIASVEGEFDPDAGYNSHLGVIATGEAVVPGASLYVANNVLYVADGTSAKPSVAICVRAGNSPGHAYYRCGGRCYAILTAAPTVGGRVYQSTTAGKLTDIYADGLQDVGQYVSMVPSSDGTSLIAIIDYDYSIYGTLTTANIGVDSGDPFQWNLVGGELQLKGINGTWDVQGGTLTFSNGIVAMTAPIVNGSDIDSTGDQIDSAVALSHTQNTDTGTTSNVFSIETGRTSSNATLRAKLDFGGAVDMDILFDADAGNISFLSNGSPTVLSAIGSLLTALNASELSSGTVPLARLADIANAQIAAAAAIAYSKLNLTGNIVNADISASAAIVDTKLDTISTAGKVSDSALSSNVPLKNTANTFTAIQTFSGATSLANAFTFGTAGKLYDSGSIIVFEGRNVWAHLASSRVLRSTVNSAGVRLAGEAGASDSVGYTLAATASEMYIVTEAGNKNINITPHGTGIIVMGKGYTAAGDSSVTGTFSVSSTSTLTGAATATNAGNDLRGKIAISATAHSGQATFTEAGGLTILTVSTAAIAAGDVVAASYDGDDFGCGLFFVHTIVAATSFKITVSAAASGGDAIINWRIIH